MGWICFGGNVEERNGVIHATVLDSSRNRLFIAPPGLWITLDAGHLDSVDFDKKGNVVRLHLAAESATSPVARLRIKQTSMKAGAQRWEVAAKTETDAGAEIIPLHTGETVVTLQQKAPQ
jgi:hypothetical protein